MSYMSDKQWLKDEIRLAINVLEKPEVIANTYEMKVGACVGACRAATIILEEIIDAINQEEASK